MLVEDCFFNNPVTKKSSGSVFYIDVTSSNSVIIQNRVCCYKAEASYGNQLGVYSHIKINSKKANSIQTNLSSISDTTGYCGCFYHNGSQLYDSINITKSNCEIDSVFVIDGQNFISKTKLIYCYIVGSESQFRSLYFASCNFEINYCIIRNHKDKMKYGNRVDTSVLFFENVAKKRALFNNCDISSNTGRLVRFIGSGFTCTMMNCKLSDNTEKPTSYKFTVDGTRFSQIKLNIKVQCSEITPPRTHVSTPHSTPFKTIYATFQSTPVLTPQSTPQRTPMHSIKIDRFYIDRQFNNKLVKRR